MSGWILLIIGLLSLALVLAMLAWTALKGWRLFKRGRAVARSTGGLAAEVARQASGVEMNVARLQENSAELQHNLERLRASAERLRILFEAFNVALGPYRSLRAYFGR